MTESWALPVLLSRLLVAHTIEFDNAFEQRMPHRSTYNRAAGERRSGPWIVSKVMWANVLRHIPERGLPVAELPAGSRSGSGRFGGLERWGYLQIVPDGGGRQGPVVHLTRAGQAACRVWAPLDGEIDQRWRARFGDAEVTALRDALRQLVIHLPEAGPAFFPVLTHEMFVRQAWLPAGAGSRAGDEGLPGPSELSELSELLSRSLLAIARGFERDSPVSLVIALNVLRVLGDRGDESDWGDEGCRLADLPALGAVSKEAVSMALTVLTRHRFAVIEPDRARSRGKVARLTVQGRVAQQQVAARLGRVASRLVDRVGVDVLEAVESAARAVLDQRIGGGAALAEGLRPYPAGWRAQRPYLAQTEVMLRDPAVGLPRFPMCLHRGGWPDGN